MKNRYFYIGIVFTIILVACGAQPPSTNEDPQQKAENHVENEIGEEDLNNDNTSENEIEEEQNIDNTSENDQQIEKGENMVDHEKQLTKYRINQQTWIVEPIADANEKIVLLTIDDAPDKYTLEMANTLKQLDANAIFFVNGHFLQTDEAKENLQQIHQLGFIIGNHTYTHPNLKDLTEEEQREEIVQLNDLVEDIIGERPKFFRPPFGEYTDTVKEIVTEEEMILMNWTFGYDWQADYHSPEKLVDITLNAPELNHGANILMHDRKWTSLALEEIVLGLREQGYEIVDPHLIEVKE